MWCLTVHVRRKWTEWVNWIITSHKDEREASFNRFLWENVVFLICTLKWNISLNDVLYSCFLWAYNALSCHDFSLSSLYEHDRNTELPVTPTFIICGEVCLSNFTMQQCHAADATWKQQKKNTFLKKVNQ